MCSIENGIDWKSQSPTQNKHEECTQMYTVHRSDIIEWRLIYCLRKRKQNHMCISRFRRNAATKRQASIVDKNRTKSDKNQRVSLLEDSCIVHVFNAHKTVPERHIEQMFMFLKNRQKQEKSHQRNEFPTFNRREMSLVSREARMELIKVP